MVDGTRQGSGETSPRLDARRLVRSSGWDRLFSGAGLLLVLLFALFAVRGWLPGRAEALSPPKPDPLLLTAPLALGETDAERRWSAALLDALAHHLAGRARVVQGEDGPVDATTYIPQLARRAGARAALTATLFEVEGGVRIQLRLIPADASTRRWQRRYEQPWPGDIAAGADTVARAVVEALYGPAEE